MAEKLEGHQFDKIEDGLTENTGIHFRLNGNGLIHIERELPFLLVYRPLNASVDKVIEKLVKNEASYLICPQEEFAHYRQLLERSVKKLSDKFGAFLLMEVWPDTAPHPSAKNTAIFELRGPEKYLPRILRPLKSMLKNMDLEGMQPVIRSAASEKRCPDNIDDLLDRKSLKKLECLLLGLKVEPFYMDTETKQVYPLLERSLYSEFSRVFKKSVYDFLKVQSSHRVSGFQSLAKREIKEAVWKIDKQLVDIDKQLKFLMLLSPVNGNMAWKEFKKSKYKEAPVFHYRMMPADPELLKRQLYNIRVEEIDDPTLGFLFREKRAEIDKMLSMLNDRDSGDFLYGSLQLFGSVEDELYKESENILKEFPVKETKKTNREGFYNAQEFARLARQEMRYLQKQCKDLRIRVEIKETIDNMMVDQGIFNIPARARVPKKRAKALIQHEIGTHVLTYYSGKSQPLKLLSSGIPGYEELQEGIAVLAEHLSGGLSISRMQVLAARVIAVDSMINEQDFIQTFRLLTDEYHFKSREAFSITTRVYRSGGLTKDAIYLRGLINLVKYLQQGKSLEPLLIGKIRQNYLPITNELISREILKPMPLKPRYLHEEDALQRLSDIKNIKKITELINTGI